MSYATLQNLQDKFGPDEILQLADRDADGMIDAGVVEKALADADALVDAYVGKRHDLPLEETPPRVADVAAEIAYFKLFRGDPPEYARKLYEDAMRFLRDVASGAAVIEIAGGIEPARDGQVVLADGPARTFDRKSLKGF
jgi:phage gp36-like protein